MFAVLRRHWRRPAIATRAEFAEFLDRHAAMLTNRSVIGYCQVKTRLPLHELTREPRFAEAFERGRSEAYAAILADLMTVAEGLLRQDAPVSLADGLATLYDETLARHPLPAHRPEGWGDEVAKLRDRLRFGQEAPPRRVADVAERSAARVYETMPIHESLRSPDEPAIKANVQFLIVGLYRDFERRLDRAALARALTA
jgi:hypothetical protein